MKFGISIPTYWRPDGSTKFALEKCLWGITQQSHDDWVVYLIGDKYEKDDELRDIASVIPPSKLHLLNLEVAAERDTMTGHQVWQSGGINALNHALAAQRIDGIEITTHSDDDDFWLPHHLETLAAAYEKHDADFVFTSAFEGDWGRVWPPINHGTRFLSLRDNHYPLIHSSASWKLASFPQDYEVSETDAGDCNMWKRMDVHAKTNDKTVLFVAEVTVMKSPSGRELVESYY